jgi:hypothetical protein
MPGSAKGLVIALGLLSVGALQGGIAMLMDPYQPLGMTPVVLVNTPLDSFLLPGLFLLGMAAASLITLVGVALGRSNGRFSTVMGSDWRRPAALAVGVVLLIFELIELALIPFQPIMHPLLIVLALAIIGLGSAPSARVYLDGLRPRPTASALADTKDNEPVRSGHPTS